MLDSLDDYTSLVEELQNTISNGLDKLKSILGDIASKGVTKL